MVTDGEAIEVLTDRLTLRPMPPAAAALLPGQRAACADLIGAVLDDAWPLPDVRGVLARQAVSTPGAAPFGIWTMVEQASPIVVGDVGFHGPPGDHGVVEIGYSVVPSRRGRGYASEAVGGLTRWVLAQPGVTKVVAGTVPGNGASERVLEKLGFTRTEPMPGENRWASSGRQ